MRRIVVEAKKYPVRLKNNAEERRPVVVVRLAASGKLRKHFAEVIEVVPELVSTGPAECGFDLLSDFVGVVNEACGVNNAAHMQWLVATAHLRASLQFGGKCALAFDGPALLNIE
jgi:hypothetical protein